MSAASDASDVSAADSGLVLVVAKAPVAGQAKTRLARHVGDEAAAGLASAALLDTLAAAEEAVGVERCCLALTGDLEQAADGDLIAATVARWRVVPQRGDGFAERLANAHADAGPGPRVQVGMDTPQLEAAWLREALGALHTHDAVLGPALDGGWWLLGLRDPDPAIALADVPMSTDTTGADTAAALRGRGLDVGTVAALRDVDTADDAAAVALEAPGTRFARRWAGATSATGLADPSDPGAGDEHPW